MKPGTSSLLFFALILTAIASRGAEKLEIMSYDNSHDNVPAYLEMFPLFP